MSEIASLIEDCGAVKRGTFKLSDGSLTGYYVDKYAFETNPEVLDEIAEGLRESMAEDVDVVAGPALGAVPLVTAISLRTGLPSAYVRKGQKHSGTQARVEGEIEKGQRVAVVEDVTTTGGTILETARMIEELGGAVEQLLVVVDRNEGAVENVRSEGYELEYLAQIGTDIQVE